LGFGVPGVWDSGWWGNTCVKNLSQVAVEVCAKFGGDWSGGSCTKEGHRYKQSFFIDIGKSYGLGRDPSLLLTFRK